MPAERAPSQPKTGDETAGVVAPPPVIFATALVLGWLLNRVVPLPFLPPPFLPLAVARWSGTALVAGAMLLAGAALLEMRRARTAVDPYKPSTALVRSGPFAYSRNPIYVALILLSLGLALVAGAPWCVLLLLPAIVVLRRGVVAREEAYLERRFGAEYRAYCAATRRWI